VFLGDLTTAPSTAATVLNTSATVEHISNGRTHQQHLQHRRYMRQPTSHISAASLVPLCSVWAANYRTASRVLRKNVQGEPQPRYWTQQRRRTQQQRPGQQRRCITQPALRTATAALLQDYRNKAANYRTVPYRVSRKSFTQILHKERTVLGVRSKSLVYRKVPCKL
jgi:hypothetical protein